MLENNKTTRPATSWFQMFSRVWKPYGALALVLEIIPELFSCDLVDIIKIAPSFCFEAVALNLS